jgi:2-oxo-4-hydroxy-4-carboxy-5-ureidoimidazoline decarboxylase
VRPALGLPALNGLDRRAFTQVLGAVFERSPWVAERAWERRPFSTLADLHTAMMAVVGAASAQEQLDLLRAHPDLAGRAARAGAMSTDSVAEQTSVGLDRLSDDEYARFHRLNAAYRERFGFPFIIAARRHDKAAILAAFERRLGQAREQETETALAQVAEIARLRLERLVIGP